MVKDDLFLILVKCDVKSASYCNRYDEINWLLHGVMLYIFHSESMFSIVKK